MEAGVMYEVVDSLGNLIWGPYAADSQKKVLDMNVIIQGIIALEPYTEHVQCTSWL